MNKEELEREIAKFKARKSKTRLAYYSLAVSLFLVLSSFGNGLTLASLITCILILPLPLYFGLQCLKLTRKLRAQRAKSAELESLAIEPSQFSLIKFLTQPNFSFRLSLVLLLLVGLTTIARLRAPQPTLSYQTSTNR